MLANQNAKGAGVGGNFPPVMLRWLALAGGCLLLILRVSGQSLNVLYAFPGVDTNALGGYPSGLMLSTNGNFYGTCVNEGTEGWGAIYKMTPAGTPTALNSFMDGADGANPIAALAQGTNGMLYGMASAGGSNGYGTIFEMSTNGTCAGLYSFAREKGANLTNANGAYPKYALVLNTNNNNFYGIATDGGTNGYGTVFQVTHQGKVTVYYSFSNLVDGSYPEAPLLFYTNGLLYGTAAGGGSNSLNYGTVFQVTTAGAVKALYSFTNGSDGSNPQGALIDGKDGHLYGTCAAGGSNGSGTIFKITTNGVLTSLYSFTPGTNFSYDPVAPEYQYNADGINPNVLLLGSDGNFYGVAYYGGQNASGTVFQFTRAGSLNVLHSFDYSQGEANADGSNPTSLIQGTNGNFYGTALRGGVNSNGTFFTLGLPPTITVQPSNQWIALHGNATFSVTASNAQSCQWQFDGVNLTHATNDTLSIFNAQITNAGSYQAIVTNLNGATASALVTLSLTNVPVSFESGPGALQFGGGQLSFFLTNLTGQGAIVIEASSNLIQWTPIYTNPAGFGAAQFIDSTAGNYPFRYYRATAP